MKKIILLCFLVITCEDVKRVWDNPYDPRSDKSLWTPDSLKAEQISLDEIELSWQRKGRDFDGFKIGKKMGEGDWQDSVAILWDSIYSWIDTLDLKEVVKNHVEYSYRLYAYADTNISNIVGISIKPIVPGPLGPVDVISVDYVPNETIYAQEKNLTVQWEKSLEGSFKKYHLHHTIENSSDTSVITFDDVNTTSWDTNKFNPKKQNWYWVELEDSTGQITKGNAKANSINEVPPAVQLDSITYNAGFFELKWSPVNIEDFQQYIIQHINISTGDTIDSSPIFEKVTGSDQAIANQDEEHKYQIITIDVWGDSSFSNIRNASSYQRIVTVDNIVETGADITISNLGPNLSFKHVLNQVNAYFPIWIQNGEKVFSFYDGGVGLVVDKNGTNLKKISGEEPQDIAFYSDQSQAVYTGSDHNLYLVDLKTDIKVKKQLTDDAIAIVKNEWYGDPEFITVNGVNDALIMYWHLTYQANNNIGVSDIYYMDKSGNMVDRITNAQNTEKLIMPRMSPDGKKILFVKKDDGLYVMNTVDKIEDQKLEKGVAVTTVSSNAKVLPVVSQYFRNIHWSPNSERAVFWEYKNNSYFLYVFERGTNQARILQAGARYADWFDNSTVIFRSESSNKMYKISVTASLIGEPVLLDTAPWAQLQPR